VIAQNIHGLLAKRTRKRFGVDRKTEKTGNGGDKDLGWQNGVFAISSRGNGRNPGICVLTIKTTQTLLVTRRTFLIR
jgi:hypothetical protein